MFSFIPPYPPYLTLLFSFSFLLGKNHPYTVVPQSYAASNVINELTAIIRPPIFIHEPPHSIKFVNSTGTILSCSAGGNPPPTILWYSKDGKIVSDIPGLRVIRSRSGGSSDLILLPFPPFRFTPDVHLTAYRCHASNLAGTTISRDSFVRAGKSEIESVVFLFFLLFFMFESPSLEWPQSLFFFVSFREFCDLFRFCGFHYVIFISCLDETFC